MHSEKSPLSPDTFLTDIQLIDELSPILRGLQGQLLSMSLSTPTLHLLRAELVEAALGAMAAQAEQAAELVERFARSRP